MSTGLMQQDLGWANPQALSPESELIPLDGAHQGCWLLPSEQVLLTRVAISSHKSAELRQAIPYALEEQLSEAVESLHFAWGESQDGQRPVAVIERQLMAALMQRERPQRLLPDCLALPWQAGRWSIVIHGGRAIIRSGQHQGFACPQQALPGHLALLAAQALPDSIDLWSASVVDATDWPRDIPVNRHPGPGDHEAGLKDWLVQHGLPAAGLNLITGEFADRKAGIVDWRHWWLPVLLLLALPVLDIWQGQQRLNELEQRSEALQQQTAALLREVFPDIRRVVNARVQMAQRLDELRQQASARPNAGFLELFGQVMAELQKAAELRLQAVTWRNRQLQLQVQAADISPFEAVKQSLAGQGLELEIRNVSRENDGMTLRLVVQEADR